MPKVKRGRLALEAERRNVEQLARLGREVYDGRKRRCWTEQQLARRVDLPGPSAESSTTTRLFAWRRHS